MIGVKRVGSKIRLAGCQSVRLTVRLTVSQVDNQSVRLSVRLTVGQSVRLAVSQVVSQVGSQSGWQSFMLLVRLTVSAYVTFITFMWNLLLFFISLHAM